MTWSTGIDAFAGNWRVLSAKTSMDEAGHGHILFNAVGGSNTHLHAGFQVSPAGTLAIWGVATADGAFFGQEQSVEQATPGVSPVARLEVDPAAGACQLALTLSSVNSLPEVKADQREKRLVVPLPTPGAAGATYVLGLTADEHVASDVSSDGGGSVYQLFGSERPVWLHVRRL